MTSGGRDDAMSLRARAWHHSRHDAACDLIEPWAHGTVVRASSYPDYWDLNLVRVEEKPAMGVTELIAFTDEALDGLEHRRLDFDLIDAAEELRAEFEAAGFEADRFLLMRHGGAAIPRSEIAVEEVPYDSMHDLRIV